MINKSALNFFTILILSLFIWWALELSFGVFTGIDGLGFKFHKACVEFTENKGIYDFLNLKVLCSYNQNISLQTTSQINSAAELQKNLLTSRIFLEKDFFITFLNLGLIHLLVASGSHLLILNQGSRFIFGFLTPSKIPNYIVLFLFVLISNFCCPVTRSFFQIIITALSRKQSLGWSKINMTFLASSIYLLFFPSSLFTLSFWLSVSASLCLALFSSNALLLSFTFYFVLFPYIYDFTPPSVTSIFANIIITPILGPLLIWNSVLYVFISTYRPLGDFILATTIDGLKAFIVTPLEIENQKISLAPFAKYFYGLTTLIMALYFQNLKSKKIKSSINVT